MTALNERPSETPAEIITWEVELQKVGLVRRILNARRWYGADWWFVTVSALLVLVFIVIALLPGLFALTTRRTGGPSFLAPGSYPPVPMLVVPITSAVNSIKDLQCCRSTPSGGRVIQGGNTAGALNDAAKEIDNQIKNESAACVCDQSSIVMLRWLKCCRRSSMGKTLPQWLNQMNSKPSRLNILPCVKGEPYQWS